MREQEAKSGGKESFAEKIAENNQKIAGINDEIAGRYADIHNFESPEFSLLSHADKAALYKKRAKKNFMSAMAQSAPIASGAVLGAGIGGTMLASAAGAGMGASGSAGGALAGLGAGIFYGPALAAQTAGIGSGIAGAENTAATLAVEGIAGRMPHKQKSKSSVAGSAYVPVNHMTPQVSGSGAFGGNGSPTDDSAAGYVVPANPLPPGSSAAAGREMRHSPAFQNIIARSSGIYDANEKASRFVSRNFGNISSHLSEKMMEPGFHDEVKRGMQGAVSQTGYGKLSFVGKQQALSRGGAEVFAKSAMKMLEKEGLLYDTAEYSQIYNRLLEEFSAEKTIQKMAGAMLDQEKKILDFVDQDRTE